MISRSIVTLSITGLGVLLGVIMASALVPKGPPDIGFHKAWPRSAESISFQDNATRSLRADRAKVQELWDQSPGEVLIYYAPIPVWSGPIPPRDTETLGIEIE